MNFKMTTEEKIAIIERWIFRFRIEWSECADEVGLRYGSIQIHKNTSSIIRTNSSDNYDQIIEDAYNITRAQIWGRIKYWNKLDYRVTHP